MLRAKTFIDKLKSFNSSPSQLHRPYSSTPVNSTISRGFDRSSYFGKLPKSVKIVEVGARDGLQSESKFLSTDDKVKLVDMLTDTGLKSVEATAFVSPRWIPQMEDAPEVMKRIKKRSGVSYPVLVPNITGFENAIKAGSTEVAIFVAATETFSEKNRNSSIDRSFERCKEVADAAKKMPGIKVRGYVSCVMGCPYEGDVPISKVVQVTKRLYELGCYEVSLGDTIGVGTPGKTFELLSALIKAGIPVNTLALHAHDTYGQALSNILTAIQFGVGVIDSSVAGLGGCPYAKGATGNVSTEEVVYMLRGLGIEVGVDLDKLVKVGMWVSKALGKPNQSKLGNAVDRKGSLPPNYIPD